MTSGISVFLAAVGAILAFAVRDNLSAVDLTMIGYILMLAGAVGLAISLMRTHAGRRTTVVENTAHTPAGSTRTTEVDHAAI